MHSPPCQRGHRLPRVRRARVRRGVYVDLGGTPRLKKAGTSFESKLHPTRSNLQGERERDMEVIDPLKKMAFKAETYSGRAGDIDDILRY